ncbi:unnamed protein product [Closterium sp. NIES-53]
MGTKLAMSLAYHPQTDGQTERLNQIVEQLVRAACKDDISKWDAHLPVFEFAYNNATHAAIGQTPFFLCYGRNPLTPQKPTVPATVQPAHDLITTMHHLWERTHKRLLTIQQQQKKLADRSRNNHSIKIGDQVLLDTRNLESSHLPSKLRPCFYGPFLVEAQPYRDPNTVFKGRQPPPPLPVIVNGEPEYEVEAVLAHRRQRNGTLELLIRWKGYDPSEDSWVPEHDMDNARRPLQDYLVKQVKFRLRIRSCDSVLPSQDVTFDESVPFYRLFPYRFAPPLPPPLFLAPGPPPVDPLPPQGPAPSGVSQVDPLPGPAPVQVAVDSGAARGAASGGAEPGGAGSEGAEPGGVGTGGAEPGGAEPEGVEPGGAASDGAESGGAEPQGAASSGGSALSRGFAGASPRLSPQQLREWFVRRARLRGGGIEAGGAGAAGAGVTGGTAATGPGGACTLGTRAAGTGGVAGAGAGDPTEPGAVGAGGAGAVLGTLSSTGLTPPLLCPLPDRSQPPLQPASPLPAPSPYTEQSGGRTERRAPASHPVSPVRTAHRTPRSRPPVPGTHAMALRPSSVPLRVPLPAPPESSLLQVPDPESDCARAASPAVSRLLATAVTDPSFESTTASALVAELLEFAAACRLDYATTLAAESASAGPPSVGGECALGTDVLEDRQEDFECLAVAVPRFASMLLALEGDPDAPGIPTPAAVTLS